MIKTYEIDFDDKLVSDASKLFEELGTDIDTAINIFLKQAVLRRGFPFEVAIPTEMENGELRIENSDEISDESAMPEKSENSEIAENSNDAELSDDLHGGISEEEENAASVVTSSVSPDVAARVAANEALVAQMRDEIGDKNVVPEFDENEEEALEKEQAAISNGGVSDDAPAYDSTENEQTSESDAENDSSTESDSSEKLKEDESEDEDETTPDNLFDAWDVGEEEDIGCQ